MTRDLNEILLSQQKMLGKREDVFPVKLYNQYQKLLAKVESFVTKEPGLDILYVDYKATLENPDEIIDKVQKFIGINLDKESMAKMIDRSLYRSKLVDTEVKN